VRAYLRPRDLTDIVAHLTTVLGEPIATPDTERYRTFSWCCPRCLAGTTDIDYWLTPCARSGGECECGSEVCLALLYQMFPYRPFTVDSNGQMWCSACRGSEKHLVAAIKRRAG